MPRLRKDGLPDRRAGRLMPSGADSHAYRHGHATGESKTREYLTWRAMTQRCSNPKAPAFYRYGGRGIAVCDRWRDFKAFLADMGPRPPGTSLDRRDNDKGYSPDNCRWATRREQAENTRTVTLATIDGETCSVGTWAARLRLDASTVRYRIRRLGMTPEQALLATPARKRVNRFDGGHHA